MTRLYMRKMNGQTMGLVAVAALVLLIFGVGCYFLIVLMGGGREASNATDAGDLSIAKNALSKPRKKLSAFPNPDVLSNFSGLSDDGYVNLKVYNRMVGQALLVSLNAKDSLSSTAGDNAVKVWRALNDVAQFLRVDESDQNVMGSYFSDLADRNNTRMLTHNKLELTNLSVGFMKRGFSTNLAVNPLVYAGYHFDPKLPLNEGGRTSSRYGGVKYLAGYKPYVVEMSNGAKIAFSGVTTLPGDKPHLVSTGEFEKEREDDFVVGKGVPAYPANTLPANSFKSSSKSKVDTNKTFLSAVAAAIVGSLDQDYTMSIPNGYLMIINGPSNPPATRPASKDLDIFSHELATGIATNGVAFANSGNSRDTGRNGEIVIPGSSPAGCWDSWYHYNTVAYPRYQRDLADYQARTNANPSGTTEAPPRPPDVPCNAGIYSVKTGGAASSEELRQIKTEWCPDCIWTMYSSNPKQICVDELPVFKQTYNRPGSWDTSPYADSGFTNLENVKVAVQGSRFNVSTCASVNSPPDVSGVKYFDHAQTYASPGSYPYNFGVEKSPMEYLEMIDQTSGACGATDIATFMKHAADQILPGAGSGLSTLLRSKPLKLGQTFYVYRVNDHLVMDSSPPPGKVLIPPTVPDGTDWQCGKPYPVLRKFVDATMDENMPTPYDEISGDFKCTDKALWHSHSGYNNLLGVLKFTNQCDPSATFCKPN